MICAYSHDTQIIRKHRVDKRSLRDCVTGDALWGERSLIHG